MDELKRTATQNGGAPLGRDRFEKETGIRTSDWEGRYWARWNDVVREAGLEPNAMTAAYADDQLLEMLAEVVRDLGHVPTYRELRLRCQTDRSLPNDKVFSRLGTKDALIAALSGYCDRHEGWEDVAALCQQDPLPDDPAPDGAKPLLGDVYLIKSGRCYKIGYSVSADRRTREFQIQLPDLPQRIHTIRTDDPRGVEAYWHKRFEVKRVRPDAEFFKLDAADVRAFRAWKRIAP